MKTTQIKTKGSNKVRNTQRQTRARAADADKALLEMLGPEVFAEVQPQAEAEGVDVRSYVVTSVAKCVHDDARRRALFGDKGGITLRIPVSWALHAAIGQAATAGGVEREELMRTALVRATTVTGELAAAGPQADGSAAMMLANGEGKVVCRVVLSRREFAHLEECASVGGQSFDDWFAMVVDGIVRMEAETPEQVHGMRPAAAGAPPAGGSAAASVPMRSETVGDYLAGCRRRRAEDDGLMEVETFGLVPETDFTQAELLEYVCSVFDGHRDYLARVVARELSARDQTLLLEALAYAGRWCFEMADKGTVADPMQVRTLPGLAGRRRLSHARLMEWLLYAVSLLSESITRHFLAESAPSASRIEWGELLAMAEAVAKRDSAGVEFAPSNRAEVKAAALLRAATWMERLPGKEGVAA